MSTHDDTAQNASGAQAKNPPHDDKKERLAKALRDNLLRRKAAARKADEANE